MLLKKEAATISSGYLARLNGKNTDDFKNPDGSLRNQIACLARYNRRKFAELKDKDCPERLEEIDNEKLEDFIFRINRYMDKYAPGQCELKAHTRIISIYLTFIAKEPLHPPGMSVNEKHTIFKRDGVYYCPAKSKYILDELSLCKYCVCRPTNWNSFF